MNYRLYVAAPAGDEFYAAFHSLAAAREWINRYMPGRPNIWVYGVAEHIWYAAVA